MPVEGILARCFEVIYEGNRDCSKVYSSVWTSIRNGEAEGCTRYQHAVAAMRAKMPKKNPSQRATDATTLYQHAGLAKPLFDEWIAGLRPCKAGDAGSGEGQVSGTGRWLNLRTSKDLPCDNETICDTADLGVCSLNHGLCKGIVMWIVMGTSCIIQFAIIQQHFIGIH